MSFQNVEASTGQGHERHDSAAREESISRFPETYSPPVRSEVRSLFLLKTLDCGLGFSLASEKTLFEKSRAIFNRIMLRAVCLGILQRATDCYLTARLLVRCEESNMQEINIVGKTRDVYSCVTVCEQCLKNTK